jgi:hypothetical protein
MTLSDDLIGQTYGNNGNGEEEDEQKDEAEETCSNFGNGKDKGSKKRKKDVGQDKDAQIKGKPKSQCTAYKYSNKAE